MKTLVTIAFVFIVCSLFFLLFPGEYYFLHGLYIDSLVKTSSFFLDVFHVKYVFDRSSYSFLFESFAFKIDTQYAAALKSTFFVLATVLVLSNYTTGRKGILIVFFVLLIFFLNSLCLFSELYYVSIHCAAPAKNYHLLFLALLYLLPLVICRQKIYDSKRTLTHKVVNLLLVFGVLLNLFRFFFSNFIDFVYDSITYVIFSFCKWFLELFNIYVNFNGRLLFDARTSLRMGDACVGLEIMGAFLIILLITNGKKIHKLIYLIGGLAIIIMLNVLRISLLFAYIHGTTVSELSLRNWHAVYNNVIYASVFFLWVGWFWVQKKMQEMTEETNQA